MFSGTCAPGIRASATTRRSARRQMVRARCNCAAAGASRQDETRQGRKNGFQLLDEMLGGVDEVRRDRSMKTALGGGIGQGRADEEQVVLDAGEMPLGAVVPTRGTGDAERGVRARPPCHRLRCGDRPCSRGPARAGRSGRRRRSWSRSSRAALPWPRWCMRGGDGLVSLCSGGRPGRSDSEIPERPGRPPLHRKDLSRIPLR